ncbi:MAG: Ig-like domain-containing protein [Acidobacteriota bacterium]
MRTSPLLVLILPVVFAAACHKGNNTSTTPTPVTPGAPTVTQLSLSPVQALQKMTQSQQLTATATLSDGTSNVAQPTWTTDAPAVVSVSSTGVVGGLSPGQANVFADYRGQRATASVRIVPDYGGGWSGAFFITNCQLSGDWTRTTACDGEVSSTNWKLTLAATQDGTSVAATVISIVDMPVATTGDLAVDGTLTLAGSSTVRLDGDDWTAQVTDWQTRTITGSQVRGKFTFLFGLRQYQGGVQWTCEIPYLDRASLQPQRSPTLFPASPASHAVRR